MRIDQLGQKLVQWNCEECGVEVMSPQTVAHTARLCFDCDEKIRLWKLSQLTHSREDFLRYSGCDALTTSTPFKMPDPVPVATNGYAKGCPVTDWHRKKWGTLLLAGPVGTGKTMLAAEMFYRESLRIAEALQPQMGDRRADHWLHRWCRWIDASELHEVLMDWNRGEKQAQVRGASILVIDEAGANLSPIAWEKLGIFVNSRYRSKRGTILTTNLSPQAEDSSGRKGIYGYHPRLADRLYEGMIVVMAEGAGGGRSLRRKGAGFKNTEKEKA